MYIACSQIDWLTSVNSKYEYNSTEKYIINETNKYTTRWRERSKKNEVEYIFNIISFDVYILCIRRTLCDYDDDDARFID